MNPVRLILIRSSIAYTTANNEIYISAKTIIMIIRVIIVVKSIDRHVANKRNTQPTDSNNKGQQIEHTKINTNG